MAFSRKLTKFLRDLDLAHPGRVLEPSSHVYEWTRIQLILVEFLLDLDLAYPSEVPLLETVPAHQVPVYKWGSTQGRRPEPDEYPSTDEVVLSRAGSDKKMSNLSPTSTVRAIGLYS